MGHSARFFGDFMSDMKKKLYALLLILALLVQCLSVSVTASDAEASDAPILEGTPGIRTLMAQQSLSGPEDLELDGQSALLYEMTTGTMVFSKNVDTRWEPGSLTKVMTCLLALKHGNPADSVDIVAPTLSGIDPESSTAGLLADETYTLEQLLFMLIVRSANDAAAVIAEHIAGSQSTFIDMMNTEAVELGCENTHFTNPHGLPDEEQYTTARDIAIIMEAALAYPLFGELYAATTYQAPSTELQAARTFYTSNFLITEDITPGYLDSRVIGGFVGTTSAAGRCAACVAEYDSLRYLVVILGSSSLSDENGNPVYTNLRSTSALLDYACSAFMPQRVLSADTTLTPIPVNYGDRDVVPITASGITALLPTNYDESLLRTEVTLPDGRLVAPIAAGSEIGSADMYYGSFLLGTVPLTASNEISLVDASEDENAAGQESATGRALRITVTVVASIIGGIALILLLLMIRASIIRALRKRRRQRERAIRNAKKRRRQ